MSLTVLILLVLAGLLLIVLDLFFIPGGVVAFLGLALIVYADYRSFIDLGEKEGYWFVVLSAILSALLIWQFFRPDFWLRFGPKGEISGKVNTEDLQRVKTGDQGITVGVIRPSGMARFNGELIEVYSRNEIIRENTRIEITAIENNRIYIKPLENT